MDAVDERGTRPRGTPLVATPLRWLATTGILAAVLVGLAHAYVRIVGAALGPAPSYAKIVSAGSLRTVSLAVPLAIAVATAGLVVFAMLRSEEARLGRELRVARTGTAVLRSLVARRGPRVPILGGLFATDLGKAAVFLAGGDASTALDVLSAEKPWMRSGRLERLRAIVTCDADRASGGVAALDRCIRDLGALPPTGNREADLYRLHVLVKAVLARGDDETAEALAARFASSPDDDERVYGVWLRVWFELDADDPSAWPPLGEADVRLAALAARAHGAEKLVGKLEERLLAIARHEPQG